MTPPAALMERIADNRAVAFLGSGLSLAAGLPDWTGLMKELANEAHDSGVATDEEYNDLLQWAGQSDFLMLADALVEKLGRDGFIRFMKRRIGAVLTPTAVHQELSRVPFAAYVTTNFDTLLERAWSQVHSDRLDVFTNANESELSDPFRNRTPFLVKVHGDIQTPESLVLGLKDFRRAIHENDAYRIFMQDVLRHYSIVFLGYSLSDPDVLNILDQLVTAFKGVPGEHFALVDESKMSPLRAGVFYRNYGIRVIRYRKSAPDHPEVLSFVKSLAAQAPTQKAKKLNAMPVVVANDEATRPLFQALNPMFRLNLTQWSDLGASKPVCVPRTAAPPPGSGMPWSLLRSPLPAAPAPPVGAMPDFCRDKLGPAWDRLEPWYQSLPSSPAGQLLRVNLDRECARADMEPGLWAEFLQRLAEAAPSVKQPFAALTDLIHSTGSRYLLRGRKLETWEALCRYIRLRHFSALLRASKGTDGPFPVTAGKEDSNTLRIGELLLGKPGGPSWCTTASYSEGKDAATLALEIWDGAAKESIVEIRYEITALGKDDYPRVATVPDIYSGRVEEANILKPALGEGDWCWTVHIEEAPRWKRMAPSAVHPTLTLSGALQRTMALRVIL